MSRIKNTLAAAVIGLAAASGAQAATDVTADITTDTVWTKAAGPYNLTKQIFVLNGASLTIEKGTIVASVPTVNGSGSLAVSRGSKIFVQGTKQEPVIMTSTNDTATWTGGDPKTGTWRAAANEWGNLTVMGRGLISGSEFGNPPAPMGPAIGGGNNPATPTGTAQRQMEGLVAVVGQEDNVRYGGNNDNDDSGSISYLSIRYAGRVVGLGNELNGLSLGGIGRETDIHHVDIMNNVDDGIEIWGGTVNVKYVSIWNVGDDSFDVDQGWRGKAQFVLIVQGYSDDANQGSGVGDNAFEIDGAEQSHAQPVTTAVIYNATIVGQPLDGDHATAWRDNARVQFRNCVFMDIGAKLVGLDNSDGDGGQGYGFAGTLSWANTWATPYTATSSVNAIMPVPALGTFNHPAVLYQAQTSGNLIEMTDSVFFRTPTKGDAPVVPGLLNPANNNVDVVSILDADAPIKAITRGPLFVSSGEGKQMLPVISLDPRAANDALVSVGVAPADGFFTQAPFRGAFSGTYNWLESWTAADAYGMTVTTGNAADPATTIKLTASTVFQTVVGVIYTVECSTDMQNWTPVSTVVGDGTLLSYTDLADFSSAKFYRAIPQ